MKKNYLLPLCLSCMAMALGATGVDAQTTVNKIQYTLNAAGTAYTVTGFEEGLVTADIESAIDGIPVTTINQKVFQTASELKSVNIPASITTMGNSIFQNNKSLETVTFEEGDQPLAMGGWTFNGCDKIKEVVLPARLASFGANSNFNLCSALVKVVFNGPCALKDFKAYTFTESALTELDLSGLENVEAFNANNMQNIYSSAIKVTLPKKMTPKPKDMLSKCTATEVIFPEGTTEIAAQALDAYKAVTTVSIPSTVKTIGNSAFRNCTSLANVKFAYNPTLNSSMNYCFQGCTALESIDLTPLPGVKGLVSTFFNSGLKNITFASDTQLSVMNWDLFNGTQIETIDIPASVTRFGARAFYNCSKLKTINVPAGVATIMTQAFGHDADKTGVETVIFEQKGGTWPAAIEGDTTDIILAADTKAYCYKDMTDVPEGVTTVAPIEAAKYSTYFSTTPVGLPDGVSGSVVTGVSDRNLTLDFSKYTAGQVIPASTAVLLKIDNPDKTLYPVITPDNRSRYTGVNYLVGSEDETSVAINDGNVGYVLKNAASDTFGFERSDAATLTNAANKAVLVLPATLAGDSSWFALGGTSTVIDAISVENGENDAPVYNLMGVEVDRDSLAPGIYVSKGKKFIVR